jgi:hypothetical protein
MTTLVLLALFWLPLLMLKTIPVGGSRRLAEARNTHGNHAGPLSHQARLTGALHRGRTLSERRPLQPPGTSSCRIIIRPLDHATLIPDSRHRVGRPAPRDHRFPEVGASDGVTPLTCLGATSEPRRTGHSTHSDEHPSAKFCPDECEPPGLARRVWRVRQGNAKSRNSNGASTSRVSTGMSHTSFAGRPGTASAPPAPE